jgi:SpoIID/LytB domain protein
MSRRPPSRRQFLHATAMGTAAVATHLWAPRHVGASDLSSSDRIDLLYSNQFHFNQRGEPQITVGLMHGQTKIRISSPGGILVLPSGDGGTRIEGSDAVEVTLGRSKPSQQSFSVVLAQLPGSNARAVGKATEHWTREGLPPHEFETGTVFGVDGHVLDTRRTLLTHGRHATEAAALEAARRLTDDHGALGQLHPSVSRRAEGVMVAVDATTGLRVQAEGVLWFSPRGEEPITVHDLSAEGRPAEDRTYRGSVYVAIDRHGKLSVVNLVSETELLSGLVPAEIYASAPRAALQAQAVAARGQLLAKLGTRHLDDPYLLCADQHCQVYAGRSHEHPRTNEAVRSTVGRVAMRPGGSQLVDTVYSANCGGHTEDNDVVWPSPVDPQLRAVADPRVEAKFRHGITEANIAAWLTGSPVSYSRPETPAGERGYRWTETVDPAAVAGNPGVPGNFGPLQDIVVLARGRSGRATRAKFVGKRKTIQIDGELRIRRALGGLRSSMFVVASERDRYGRLQLRGGGHGHGVGLCQHGAMGMAGAGKSVDEILEHYYRDAEIAKLW